jgi:hypothetical protein
LYRKYIQAFTVYFVQANPVHETNLSLIQGYHEVLLNRKGNICLALWLK